MRPVTAHLSRITRRIKVKRWREGEKLVWQYGFYTMHMERVEDTEDGAADKISMESNLDETTLPPIAHTYPNWGYGYNVTNEFPPLSLGSISVPLVPEAPDIRGMWKIVEIVGRVFNNEIGDDEEGWPLKHPPRDMLQRIEQAGNRVVITTGGCLPPHRIIHDMICDGTIENCADDVSGKDHVSRIRATGKFIADDRGKVHVLCPTFNKADIAIPGMEVERWLEGDRLVWKYGFDLVYLERVVSDDSTGQKRKQEN